MNLEEKIVVVGVMGVIIALGAAIGAGVAWLIMTLWNACLVPISPDHIVQLKFWQTWGLIILLGLITRVFWRSK